MLFGELTATEGQVKAYKTIKDSHHCLVLGNPGGGKSTLLGEVNRTLAHETIFCSSTGVSNSILFNGQGGSGTAHKVLSLPIDMHNLDNLKRISNYTRSLLGKSTAVKRVCIDEVGMLTPDSFYVAADRLNRFSKKTNKREARKIQMVGVGDLLQIPTILGKEEDHMIKRYGTGKFFKTSVFEEMDFNIVNLSEAKRTDDEEFKAMLDVLRYGKEHMYKECCAYFNQFYKEDPLKNLPLIAINNNQVLQYNLQALADNPNICGVYTPTIKDTYNLNNCPVGKELRIKVGLPIITLVNHQHGLYSNGSSGIVEQLTDNGPLVRFNSTGECHLVEGFDFTEKESFVKGQEILEDGTTRDKIDHKVIGTCNIIPAKLSSARTIHRVQGSTIDSPTIVDLGCWGFNNYSDFGTAITYVALSRFSNPQDIILKYKLTPKHIKVCKETVEWLQDHI